MAETGRNLELKLLDPDPRHTLAAALELDGVEDAGVRIERDTYFYAVESRLKLREVEGETAELISYRRSDRAGPRISHYRIVPVFDVPALVSVLADALGVRIVVEKARRVLRRGTVRIHLDEVAGLGRFVELEALAAEVGGLEVERDRVEDLRARLGLAEDDLLVPMGYADLLERRGRGVLVVPG